MTTSDEALEKQGKHYRNSCSSAQRAGAQGVTWRQEPRWPAPSPPGRGLRGEPPDPWAHPPGQHPACWTRGSSASDTPAALANRLTTQLFSTHVYFSSYHAYYRAFCTVDAVSGLKPTKPHSHTSKGTGHPRDVVWSAACTMAASSPSGHAPRADGATNARTHPAAPLADSSLCRTSWSRVCRQRRPEPRESREQAALGSLSHHAAHTHPSSMSIGVPSGSRSSADTN